MIPGSQRLTASGVIPGLKGLVGSFVPGLRYQCMLLVDDATTMQCWLTLHGQGKNNVTSAKLT